MNNTIGTCSLCGGPVKMPAYSVNLTPSCERCGATMKNPHGPVVPMERPVRSAAGTPVHFGPEDQ